LTEFDCFIKSFIYLADRLPRQELLEPFLDDAVAEPLSSIIGLLGAMMQVDHSKMTQAFDVSEVSSASFDHLKLCTGRCPMANLAVDEPLSQHEPDTFPCIVAMIGSGVAFMKVGSALGMNSRLGSGL
jgi:hypothetical protein